MHKKIIILIHFFSEDLAVMEKRGSKITLFCKNTVMPVPVDIAQADLSKKEDMTVFIATVSKLYNEKIKVITNWTKT